MPTTGHAAKAFIREIASLITEWNDDTTIGEVSCIESYYDHAISAITETQCQVKSQAAQRSTIS